MRRAVAADIDAMAGQLAKTFWDDPVTGHLMRNPTRREAGLRAYFRTQMKADYMSFGGCYTTEGYTGSAIWAPAGKPLLTGATGLLTMLPVLPYVARQPGHDRAPARLMEGKHPHDPLVPGLARHCGGPTGTRGGLGADAPGSRPLRRRRLAGVPGVVQGAQRALLPAPRVRGGRRGGAAGTRPADLDHVARAPGGGRGGPSISGTSPEAGSRSTVRPGGCPRAWRGRRAPRRRARR